jgi:hypothetical protein
MTSTARPLPQPSLSVPGVTMAFPTPEGPAMTTTTSVPSPASAYTMRELVDELVSRLGPDETCQQIGVASMNELQTLAGRYDEGASSGELLNTVANALYELAKHRRAVLDLPAPAGAVTVDDWHDLDSANPQRPCEGKRWDIEPDGDGSAITVLISMVQSADGTVDRTVSLDADKYAELTSRQARQLARTLIVAADEYDRLDDAQA